MNCNQTTILVKNASGKECRIGEIPDLWHIAQAVRGGNVLQNRHRAADMILEVWHQAHDMKDAISEDREACILGVVDPNDLHAVVNYDEDSADEPRSIPLIPNWKIAMDILITVIEDGTDKGRAQAFDELRQLARQVDDLQASINKRGAA